MMRLQSVWGNQQHPLATSSADFQDFPLNIEIDELLAVQSDTPASPLLGCTGDLVTAPDGSQR
jgi:hypothetical protein